MALIDKRLEAIRQITKGPTASEAVTVYLVIDVESGQTLGVFSNEDRAWEQGEEIWTVYQIETEVIDKVLDEDCLGHRRDVA